METVENKAFFTLYDRSNKPKGKVCIMERNERVSYGFSIKSSTDKWKDGTGKKFAMTRAINAINLNNEYLSNRNFIRRDEIIRGVYELKYSDYKNIFNLVYCGINLDCCKGDVIEEKTFNEVIRDFVKEIN